MTIHSDWSRLLHAECPEAFHAEPPSDIDFDVAIIDGHLQLMCLHSGFETWDAFIMAVFIRPIQRMYAAGCSTVVLCFDSYAHVPTYKAMTQIKRSKGHAVCTFGPEQALPARIPEDTMVYLMNRHFKLKVIQMACARIPEIVSRTLLVSEHPARRFIVDYKCVVEYGFDAPNTPVPVPDMVPLGESDIKFVRYVERYGNALVHAVDGDYMAIALLYYAKCGLRDNNRVFLYRQLAQLPQKNGASSSAAAATTTTTQQQPKIQAPAMALARAAVTANNNNNNNNTAVSLGKRKKKQPHHHHDDDDAEPNKKENSSSNNNNNNNNNKNESQEEEGGGKTTTTTTTTTTSPKKCWVDMQLLFATVADCVRQALRGGVYPLNPETGQPFHAADAVYSAVHLMLCAGTDFSRPIPLLGPKRLWEYLPLIAHAMLEAAPAASSSPFDLAHFGSRVLGTVYRTVFAKHVQPVITTTTVLALGVGSSGGGGGGGVPLATTLRQLRSASKLALSTQQRFPTEAQVDTTLRNIGWVVDYWMAYNSHVPAPLDGSRGYTRCLDTAAITFVDLVVVLV